MSRTSDEKFQDRQQGIANTLERAELALGRFEDTRNETSLAVSEFEQRQAIVESILHLAETVRAVGAKLP